MNCIQQQVAIRLSDEWVVALVQVLVKLQHADKRVKKPVPVVVFAQVLKAGSCPYKCVFRSSDFALA
jgi:hypothetical protein